MPARRGGRELSDAARMPNGVRRFEVDKVGDRLQSAVELSIGQTCGQTGLASDRRIPSRAGIQLGEHVGSRRAEDIHQRRVKLRAAALARYRDGRLGAAN